MFIQKKKKGFTLIEILLVVGFIALAGLGVYTVYEKVSLANAVESELRNFKIIHAGIKSLYSNNNYDGLTNEVANYAKIIPDSMKTVLDSQIKHSFNGTVYIHSATYNNVPLSVFTIYYFSVPSNVCTQIGVYGNRNSVHTSIGSVILKDKATGVDNANVSTISAACKASNSSSIYFLYS